MNPIPFWKLQLRRKPRRIRYVLLSSIDAYIAHLSLSSLNLEALVNASVSSYPLSYPTSLTFVCAVANGEQQPGGFVIVRAPSANPASRPLSRTQSATLTSTSLSQPPPTKKLRAGSQPASGPSNSSSQQDSSAERSRGRLASSSQPTALPSHMQRAADRTHMLPIAESPTINHNRAMRQGSQAPSTPKAPGHRRRSSSSSRRKRTSDLFEETGVLSALAF